MEVLFKIFDDYPVIFIGESSPGPTCICNCLKTTNLFSRTWQLLSKVTEERRAIKLLAYIVARYWNSNHRLRCNINRLQWDLSSTTLVIHISCLKIIKKKCFLVKVDSQNTSSQSAIINNCTPLHCTRAALKCTALHCTALYYPAPHCTTLHHVHCTTLHYTALHCTALHCTALHCTALHCTALHCTVLYCTALHYTAQNYITLKCTTLYCTALHCTALHSTALLYTISFSTYLTIVIRGSEKEITEEAGSGGTGRGIQITFHNPNFALISFPKFYSKFRSFCPNQKLLPMISQRAKM